MTISSTTNRVAYTGNGVTTAFSFPYYFQSAADLVVIETVIATGAQTTKALTTDYTISGTTDSNGFYESGGTVNALAAPASTVTWTIYRDPAATQTTAFVDNDPLPAASLNAVADKLTTIVQRVKDLISRSLTQPDGDSATIGRMPAKVNRASMFLAFDSNGDPIAAAGTSANLTPVSTFVNSLLGAASQAAFNTLLALNAFTGLSVGTAANDIPQLDANARLPAVDGSQLTNIASRGYVNRLRGNSMTAWFGGTSGTASTGTPTATNWANDGVLLGCTGATVAWSRVASPFAAPYTVWALKLLGQTGVTDAFARFVADSYSGAELAGRRCTFQVRVQNKTGASITPTLTVKHAGAQDDFSSPVTDVNAVALQTIANNAEGVLAYTFDANAAALNGLAITVDFGGALNGAQYVVIGEYDLRVTSGVSATGQNSNPPTVEIRDVQSDTAWNERFYETSYSNGTAPGAATHADIAYIGGTGNGTNGGSGSIAFRTPKRAAATVTLYDGAGASGKMSERYDSTWHDAIGVSVAAAGTKYATIDTTTSVLNCFAHYTADARLLGA